jgi:hypothetical protein
MEEVVCIINVDKVWVSVCS